MIAPSTRKCGLASSSGMSLQVPGSDSSALITRYFGLAPAPVLLGMNDHLSGGEARAAAAAQTGLLHRRDDVVGLHGQRLAQPLVSARGADRSAASTARARPRTGSEPESACHVVSSVPAARSARSGATAGRRGSARPASRCRRRHGRRGTPASVRAVSRKEHSAAPRVGVTGCPARSASTSSLALEGVWLSKNSQLTITTGRVVARRVALDVLEGDPAVGGGLSGVNAEVVLQASRMASPPMIAHSVFVHTPTRYSPVRCAGTSSRTCATAVPRRREV